MKQKQITSTTATTVSESSVSIDGFKSRFGIRYVTRAAIIAALYVVLTLVMWEYSYMALQVRVSEALCVLPLLFPEAVPGLFVGCILANLIVTGGQALDVVAGSLTTLFAAYLSMKIGYFRPAIKSAKYWLGLIPPVLLNAVIVGTVVLYLYGFSGFGIEESHAWKYLPYSMLTVGAGELISVYGLGTLMYMALGKLPNGIYR